jgi:protein tyrosine/serine phosphatase
VQNQGTWLKRLERSLRGTFGQRIDTPMARLGSLVHYNLFDHAFLRMVWTNQYEIAPHIYRSNQPVDWRLRRLKRQGVRTIITLRGAESHAHHLFEEETCTRLGLGFYTVKLAARSAPHVDQIERLLHLFRTVETPFLFHCKSGADRAGLAAVLYLHVIKGEPISAARRMLSWKYYHLSSTKTGILDAFVEAFRTAQAHSGVDFETWLRTQYDRDALSHAFAHRKRGAA